ncbi:unnamed protein product [Arctia plantaginis]|uniref:Uncharacterized protein n=1 Tax=Arctia plantaginis TaxID=874455 RepID=A0A8S1A8W0_ARCPL|nr:unnamed protein product [Arctia plantaginis]
MSFGKDFSLEEDMSQAVEGSAALAWRLLATLEGGSLLLATSALLAYTVRNKIVCQNRTRRNIRNVLVTNTTNLLGRELKSRLEARGCFVETVEQISDVTDNASTRTSSCMRSNKVDAIVVIGAEPKTEGLDGMASLVTEDIYQNLRFLESVSFRLHPGGYIAWACARDSSGSQGAFSDAGAAFDTVLRASLHHVAELHNCKALWVGRRTGAAKETVAALFACAHGPSVYGFSVRNAARQLGECLGRWLKILT